MTPEETFEKEYPLRFDDVSEVIDKLKTLPRTGWVQWGIEKPETVHEHIRSVRMLAGQYQELLELSEDELNDLLDMLEIHDWPEALVGDGVILGDEENVDNLRSHKVARELEAMRTICEPLNEGEYIMSLYERYSKGSDRIAKLAKQIEKLQAVFKAVEYENKCKKKGLTAEFVHYTKDLIHDSSLQNEMNIAASKLLTTTFIISAIGSTMIGVMVVFFY